MSVCRITSCLRDPARREVSRPRWWVYKHCWWAFVSLCRKQASPSPARHPNTRLGLGADGLGTHLGLETTAFNFLFVPGLPGGEPSPVPRASVVTSRGGPPGKRPRPGLLVFPPPPAHRHPGLALQAQQPRPEGELGCALVSQVAALRSRRFMKQKRHTVQSSVTGSCQPVFTKNGPKMLLLAYGILL